MYLPPAFAEHRPEVLHDLIRRHGFATVVSDGPNGLAATQLPVLLDPAHGTHGRLLSHMARANPQWQAFLPDRDVLIIFNGPHAYVSPSWYASDKAVPTWNYATVHCHGRPRLLDDPATVREVLADTVTTYEAAMPVPWHLGRLPDDFVEQLARSVVAFEVPIARIVGKWKMSQNRPAADRDGAARALADSADQVARQVAAIMRNA